MNELFPAPVTPMKAIAVQSGIACTSLAKAARVGVKNDAFQPFRIGISMI